MKEVNKKTVIHLSEGQLAELAVKVAGRLINESSFNTEEWDRLDNELRKFGDVTVSRFYSMGGKDICLAVGPQVDRRAVKTFMASRDYEYYTCGGNGDYLMMDFKYNPGNTINMNESQLVKLVSKTAARLLNEMPTDHYAQAVDRYEMDPYRRYRRAGYEILTDKDGDTIFRDPDGNEYWMDQYGHLVPFENNEYER